MSESWDGLAAAARRVQSAVEAVRGRAQSRDGSVRVEVGVDGRISALHLAPQAVALGGDRLAQLVVELHTAATEDADVQAQPLRAELVDDPRVARVMARLREAPPPARTAEDADPDDYFTTFSVFADDRRRGGAAP